MYFVKKKELIMYLIYFSYICFFVVQNSGKENLQLCIHGWRREDERDGEVF